MNECLSASPHLFHQLLLLGDLPWWVNVDTGPAIREKGTRIMTGTLLRGTALGTRAEKEEHAALEEGRPGGPQAQGGSLG